MRAYLPEILLLIPAASGVVALWGWLLSRGTIWMGLGLLTLQLAPLLAAAALLLWALRLRRGRRLSWRVPLLLAGDLVLAASCIFIALSAPQPVTLALDNQTGQRLENLRLDCAGDAKNQPEMAVGDRLELRCFPRRDGLLSLRWREQGVERSEELGYITPGLTEHFALQLRPAGTPAAVASPR